VAAAAAAALLQVFDFLETIFCFELMKLGPVTQANSFSVSCAAEARGWVASSLSGSSSAAKGAFSPVSKHQ
jgi:hypothetical protein